MLACIGMGRPLRRVCRVYGRVESRVAELQSVKFKFKSERAEHRS